MNNQKKKIKIYTQNYIKITGVVILVVHREEIYFRYYFCLFRVFFFYLFIFWVLWTSVFCVLTETVTICLKMKVCKLGIYSSANRANRSNGLLFAQWYVHVCCVLLWHGSLLVEYSARAITQRMPSGYIPCDDKCATRDGGKDWLWRWVRLRRAMTVMTITKSRPEATVITNRIIRWNWKFFFCNAKLDRWYVCADW